jgi:hypothetical protein
MSVLINSSGSWKNIPTPQIYVNGEWKDIDNIYANISGEWKEVFSLITSNFILFLVIIRMGN